MCLFIPVFVGIFGLGIHLFPKENPAERSWYEWLDFISLSSKLPVVCASGRPVGYHSPSCPASEEVPPHHCCSGPEPPSQSSPCASCSADCKWRPLMWHLTVGTVRPGRQTSPWRQDSADCDGWTSYSGISPVPWSLTEWAYQMYLKEKHVTKSHLHIFTSLSWA